MTWFCGRQAAEVDRTVAALCRDVGTGRAGDADFLRVLQQFDQRPAEISDLLIVDFAHRVDEHLHVHACEVDVAASVGECDAESVGMHDIAELEFKPYIGRCDCGSDRRWWLCCAR